MSLCVAVGSQNDKNGMYEFVGERKREMKCVSESEAHYTYCIVHKHSLAENHLNCFEIVIYLFIY